MVTPSPLLGCAIGDALGKPFENYLDPAPPNTISWDGRSFFPGAPKPHDPTLSPEAATLLATPGVTTDDTQMTRVLARVLTENRMGYDRQAALKSYIEWFQGKSWVGEPRGMGGTIRKALTRANVPTLDLPRWMGEHIEPSAPCGTGTAMRAGVLGYISPTLRERDGLPSFAVAAAADATLTHDHLDAVCASVVMATAVHIALYRDHYGTPPKVSRTFYHCLNTLKLMGYGHSAMAWAIRGMSCLLTAGNLPGYHEAFLLDDVNRQCDAVSLTLQVLHITALCGSFEKGIEEAVRMGGDTDTRAAMVGSILGARYGIEGIPSGWMTGVHEETEIRQEDATLRTMAGLRR